MDDIWKPKRLSAEPIASIEEIIEWLKKHQQYSPLVGTCFCTTRALKLTEEQTFAFLAYHAVRLYDAELKSFFQWLGDKQKFHEDLGEGDKRTDAFKLNHNSRALAFLEVRAELKHRLAVQKQAVLEQMQKSV